MWNLDVNKIPHPHIFLDSISEVDPVTRSPAVDSEGYELFKRHHHFFFADDNVVFQVEDTRFKIHRYFFQRDSEIFATIFALPGGPGQGLSDHNPIRLVDIQAKDFDIFLSILYPPKFGFYAATSVAEWSSVLDLAAKWKFESIKALAIEKLAVIASPIDKIVLGRRYNIVEWLKDAFKEVCERPSALTLEEAMRLGMEDVVTISFLRQEIRPSFGSLRASADLVTKTFGLDGNPRELMVVEKSNNNRRNWEVPQPVERSLSLGTTSLFSFHDSAPSVHDDADLEIRGGGMFGNKPAIMGFGYTTTNTSGAHETVAPVTTGTSSLAFSPFSEKDGTSSNITLRYQSITAMPAYRGSSSEELRTQDYQQGRKMAGGFGQSATFGTNPIQPSTSNAGGLPNQHNPPQTQCMAAARLAEELQDDDSGPSVKSSSLKKKGKKGKK